MSVYNTTSTPRLFRSWKTALSSLALCWCAALGACDEEDAGSCMENETQECVCPSGMGAQTCQADGSWGACSCGGGSDTSAGGGETGGGGGDGGGGGGDGGGGDSGSSSEHSCCLNGSFYACPDEGASATCFNNFDPSGCSADPSRNSECGDGGDDGGAETGGGGDDGGGVCSDPGQPCNVHGDCCDSGDVLCVDGICAAACSFDDECASFCCADLEGGGGACAPAQFC